MTTAMRRFLAQVGTRLVRPFSSLGLTCTVLLLMFVVTWRGTLAQIDIGLLEAQRKYFDSLFLVERFGAVPVPLPGGYLLMAVLAVNLLVGGIVRLRKSRRTIGVLITHLGILWLLVAGLVRAHFAVEGAIRFHEGQTRSAFTSWHDWELVVTEPAAQGEGAEEWIIPEAEFRSAFGEEDVSPVTFSHPNLPFTLTVERALWNCVVRREQGGDDVGPQGLGGFVLVALPKEKEAERNVRGAVVRVATGLASKRGIVWGLERAPWTVEVDGRRFGVTIRKRRFPLGFAIRLDRFQKKDHPGTRMPADFRSFVTVKDAGVERQVEISMNEPLRYRGYVLYQSQWSPPDAASGGRFYSVLAVARNPSDRWPLYACVVIAVGMVVHYLRMLLAYARRQGRGPATVGGAR